MMEVSLVLSARQLHHGQNHLFSDSKISSFKNFDKEQIIVGDSGIASMCNVSFLAEKQKHWSQEMLIPMVFEIKSLATTEVPFSSSTTNCSTTATSWWELKLNSALWDSEILQGRGHINLGMLDLDFTLMVVVIDFKTGDKDNGSGTIFQGGGKALSACKMIFA